MENIALMVLHLLFFWLLQLSKILPSLSLTLSSNSKVVQFGRWWLRSPSTRQSGCGTSTSKPLLLIICCLVSIRSPMLLPLAMGAWLSEARTSLMFSLYTVPSTMEPWSMIKDPKYNDNKNNTVDITEKLLFMAKEERNGIYRCIKLSFCSSKKCNWKQLLKLNCYFFRKMLICRGEWYIPLCKNVTFSPKANSWKFTKIYNKKQSFNFHKYAPGENVTFLQTRMLQFCSERQKGFSVKKHHNGNFLLVKNIHPFCWKKKKRKKKRKMELSCCRVVFSIPYLLIRISYQLLCSKAENET